MVLNLCLPAFHTTIECNKLCADGYDVTNLLSADPALRKRGFKLEYFLRPPVQVTLTFGFQVELCRVDVELWTWGMDRGQVCKRLEISTSSDTLPTQNSDQGHKGHQKNQMNAKDQKQSRQQEHAVEHGQRWGLQAQQWGGEAPGEPRQGGQAFKSNTAEPDFKLVGRCELTEETKVCFTRPNFTFRPPFVSPPPPPPPTSRKEELWSRGLLSLGAVTRLRVTVPFGGSASALGLKALAVWGQPARCCPAEEVERIKRDHAANESHVPRPVFLTPSGSRNKPTQQAASSPCSLSIPEDFLDQITQEVMLLPMLLPSGVSVDSTTLEEHQKSEATWGRAPNDPFTGVPFTSTSQPLPNPQLKSRIDRYILQKGIMRRDGTVGRQGEGENPQASRLVASKVDGAARYSPCLRESSIDHTAIQYNAGAGNASRTLPSDNGNHTFDSRPLTIDGKSESERRKKRELSGLCNESTELTAETQLLPQTKRPRNDGVSALLPSGGSHEQRLSASLDEALLSALQGRPSFTSNVCQQGRVRPEPEPLNTPQQRPPASAPSTLTGEETCSACSCSVSVFSKAASAIYRLSCGHLLCRACVRTESQPLNSVATSTSGRIACVACRSLSARSDVIRVHH